MAAYNNMHLLPRSFHGLEGLAEFNWALWSGSHNPAVKVLAKAGVLFDAWSVLQSSCCCWQNAFPCIHRLQGGSLIQGQDERFVLPSFFIFFFLSFSF